MNKLQRQQTAPLSKLLTHSPQAMSTKRKHRDDDDNEGSPRSKRRRTDHDGVAETEEERKQRRLNKKLAKQQKIKENVQQNYFGYSNEDNPFGDSQLTSLFVWKKKFEAEGLHDRQIKDIQKQRLRDQQAILKEEITKTKQRREQREKNKELEEKLHAELAVMSPVHLFLFVSIAQRKDLN